MIKNNLTRWVRPRVLGMLLAKLLLSVATPLAGQPIDGMKHIAGVGWAIPAAAEHGLAVSCRD